MAGETKKGMYELLAEVMALGAPRSDAELVVDAIMTQRSASWINNETVECAAMTEKLNKYLSENSHQISAKIGEVGMGKFIWELKAAHREEYFPPTF
ncbi:hypothetical protein FJZ26_05395 [Candidatus Parvarchaeota archaeon]|nr:hypothetical protein [Candidatus Parvarchaeota archaeon]